MPTYEYKCDNCGHHFEIYQSMKDDKLSVCPSSGKSTLKRLIGTGGGLIFKGSGFYLTDYKNKPSETTSSKSTGNGKTESTTSTDKTEKSDTKTKKEPEVKKSEKKESKPAEKK